MSQNQKKDPTITILVCMGTNCTFRGATQLMETLKAEEGIREFCTIAEMPCSNKVCDHSRRSPVVKIDDDFFMEAKPEIILDEVYRRIQKIRGN